MQNFGRGTVYNNQEDEDFGNNEEWVDEEFDERVSYASSRVHDSTYVPNQGHHNNFNAKDDGYDRYEDDQYGSQQDGEIEEIVEETYQEVGDIDPEHKKDFGSAYDQLIEKISHDQNQRDLLLSQEEYEKMQMKKIMK